MNTIFDFLIASLGMTSYSQIKKVKVVNMDVYLIGDACQVNLNTGKFKFLCLFVSKTSILVDCMLFLTFV
jgi:hypothetical protein